MAAPTHDAWRTAEETANAALEAAEALKRIIFAAQSSGDSADVGSVAMLSAQTLRKLAEATESAVMEVTAWDPQDTDPVHYGVFERKSPPAAPRRMPLQPRPAQCPAAVRALAMPKHSPRTIYIRRVDKGERRGVGASVVRQLAESGKGYVRTNGLATFVPLVIPRRIAPQHEAVKGKRRFNEDMVPVIRQMADALGIVVPIRAVYGQLGDRKYSLEDFADEEPVVVVASGETYQAGSRNERSQAREQRRSIKRLSTSKPTKRVVTVTVYPSGSHQDTAGVAVSLPSSVGDIAGACQRIELALGKHLVTPIRALYSLEGIPLENVLQIHDGMELYYCCVNMPPPLSASQFVPSSNLKMSQMKAAEKLASNKSTKSTNSAPHVYYVAHRCTQPLGLNTGHVVRLPHQHHGVGLEELMKRMTRSMHLPGSMKVEALFTLDGHRLTRTDHLRIGEHMLFACKGDKFPKKKPYSGGPMETVEALSGLEDAPYWVRQEAGHNKKLFARGTRPERSPPGEAARGVPPVINCIPKHDRGRAPQLPTQAAQIDAKNSSELDEMTARLEYRIRTSTVSLEDPSSTREHELSQSSLLQNMKERDMMRDLEPGLANRQEHLANRQEHDLSQSSLLDYASSRIAAVEAEEAMRGHELSMSVLRERGSAERGKERQGREMSQSGLLARRMSREAEPDRPVPKPHSPAVEQAKNEAMQWMLDEELSDSSPERGPENYRTRSNHNEGKSNAQVELLSSSPSP
eukprot:gene6317-7569_t